MSTLEVNAIKSRTGTDITIESGASITGTASQFKITGGTAGQALITDGAGGISFGAAGSSLPTQTGQTGKFLTTDGTDASWATVDHTHSHPDELPTQTGQAGEYLKTDGTTATWEAVDALPSQTGQAGEFLQTDGTTATWEPVTPPTATAVSDQANTSTGYFDIPAGTTAQRPGSPATGNMRWNTTDEALEHYSGSAGGWVQWAGAAPTITSISPTTSIQAGTTITVAGINFQAGSIIKLIGLDSTVYNAASTTFVSTTEVSFTTPDLPVANEPYDVKLILPAGGFFVLSNALDAGGVPAWTTAAGSLGEISHAATGTHFTLQATEPDGQVITYAETAGVLTGAGLVLNSTTGAITGDPTDVSTSTVYSFDVDATDSTGVNTTSRSFSITVTNYFAGATGGTTSTYSHGGVNYKLHKFTSNGTFSVTSIGGTADVLVVGGGGGGGWHSGAGGGAGGMIWESIAITGGISPTIAIGSGGQGRSGDGVGDSGSNSVLSYNTSSTLTGLGGGGGAYHGGGGTDGGSGGGGARNIAAGSATQSTSTDGGYGNDGGERSSGGAAPNYPAHGGGGAGSAGLAGDQSTGGVGGDGKGDFINSSLIETNAMLTAASAGVVDGSYRYLAGGGGGSMQYNSAPGGAGGKGGAGAGGNAGGPGGDATANTGSGGGGSSYAASGRGDGGSGIVVIRYIVS